MGFAGKIRVGGSDHLIASTLYGSCSSLASDVAKTVTLLDYDSLIPGTTVHVYFTNSNTAANPTLNVGGTGAYPIYTDGQNAPGATPALSWAAGSVVSFTYDDDIEAWMMNGWNVSAKSILRVSAPFPIPASSVTKTLPGITENHVLVSWGFTVSSENNPPVTLTWSTANGTFTITRINGVSPESIQPVFVLPNAITAT